MKLFFANKFDFLYVNTLRKQYRENDIVQYYDHIDHKTIRSEEIRK